MLLKSSLKHKTNTINTFRSSIQDSKSHLFLKVSCFINHKKSSKLHRSAIWNQFSYKQIDEPNNYTNTKTSVHANTYMTAVDANFISKSLTSPSPIYTHPFTKQCTANNEPYRLRRGICMFCGPAQHVILLQNGRRPQSQGLSYCEGGWWQGYIFRCMKLEQRQRFVDA